MSGGAFDFREWALEDIAVELDQHGPKYAKLAAHVRKLLLVIREVDWSLSGDNAKDADLPSMASIGCEP